jgi:hypothetical protein
LSSAEPAAIAKVASINAASATCPIHRLSNLVMRDLRETGCGRYGCECNDREKTATAR